MQTLIIHCNRFFNAGFDGVMGLVEPLGRTAEILGLALILGVIFSALFTLLVNRERRHQARNDLWAALLEIWLYRRDPLLSLRAHKALLVANWRYVRALFPPLVLALLAIFPLLVQAHYRFGLNPIAPGSRVLLTAELRQSNNMDLALEWTRGTDRISASVREPALRRVVWRLQPEKSGLHTLHLKRAGQVVEFPLYVGGFRGSVVNERRESGLHNLLSPRATPLKDDSGLVRIYVDYPHSSPEWLLWLTAGSLLAAFLTHRWMAGTRGH